MIPSVSARQKLAWMCWLSLLAVAWAALSANGWTPRTLAEASGRWGLGAYFLVFVGRSLVLLPSSPFVISGGLLFPGRPLEVILLSLLAVLVGSAIVHTLGDRLGLGQILRRRHPHRVEWAEGFLRRRGAPFVVAASFCPLIPTDLVAYLSGVLRMPLPRFLTAVGVGELPLILVYVGVLRWLGC